MDILIAKEELYELYKNKPNVNGVAVKENDNGDYIAIYLSEPDEEIETQIPSDFEGFPVKIEVIGKIRAFKL